MGNYKWIAGLAISIVAIDISLYVFNVTTDNEKRTRQLLIASRNALAQVVLGLNIELRTMRTVNAALSRQLKLRDLIAQRPHHQYLRTEAEHEGNGRLTATANTLVIGTGPQYREYQLRLLFA